MLNELHAGPPPKVSKLEGEPPAEAVSAGPAGYEQSAVRKIQLRIVPYVALLYFISFLDRANVAYAKLTMAPDLGFSEWVYGFGAGLFFLGYMLLQIPGGLIVERWGMRRITALILWVWGVCAMSLSFIHSADSFFLGRFMLGVAEGGLVPGIIIYLTHWFPEKYRARAMAGFFLCSPVALAAGGPIAALLLQIHWFGLAGWRWLAILEGIPALIFGTVTWFALTEYPEGAKWLSSGESAWLIDTLAAERAAKPAQAKTSILSLFRMPILFVLCGIIFLSNIGIQGFFLWLPTTVRRASGMSAPLAALVSGLPFVVGALSVWLCSWSSDRTQKRALHIYVPMLLAGLIFSLTASTTMPFGWLLFWLCASAAAIYGSGPSFYLLPTLLFSESSAAATVGIVNMAAGLGGFVGPMVVGKVLELGYPFSVAIKFLSVSFFLGGCWLFPFANGSRHPSISTRSTTGPRDGSFMSSLPENHALAAPGSRVAMVTGAGSGIGYAIAMGFARAGTSIFATAKSPGGLSGLKEEVRTLGVPVEVAVADLSDPSRPAMLAEEVMRRLGRVDILVNNAGVGSAGDLHSVAEFNDEFWDYTLAVNLTAPYLLSKAIIPHMVSQGWGRIINIASLAAKVGLLHGAAYAASKHGLLGLTRTMAIELADKNLTVNAICPGAVRTSPNERRINTMHSAPVFPSRPSSAVSIRSAAAFCRRRLFRLPSSLPETPQP